MGWKKQKSVFVPENFIPNTKVSVIIAARNEENSIKASAESILLQNYPNSLLELIVVDDQSEDQTPEILEEIKDPRLKIMRLGVYRRTTIRGSKKKAIAYGVNHANGDLIITTDADCLTNPNWIKSIVYHFEHHPQNVILGPVITKPQNSYLGKFQEFDFMLNSIIQASASSLNLFYLGSGANLAYSKKQFIELDPYSDNQHVASGDDVYLIHKFSKSLPKSIHFLKSTDSIVITSIETGFKNFWSQRLRWAGKLKLAGPSPILFFASLVWLSKLFILVVPFLFILFFPSGIYLAILSIIIHLIVDFLFVYEACKFYNRKKLLWLFLPMEFTYIFYMLSLGMVSWLPVKLSWKDRKIN